MKKIKFVGNASFGISLTVLAVGAIAAEVPSHGDQETTYAPVQFADGDQPPKASTNGISQGQGQDARNSNLKRRSSIREDRQASRMEEVIVTARKRAENIQDVPISIAVVTSDEINRRGLVSGEDYLRGIPGVSQTAGNQGQAVVIRGIATDLRIQNFGSGSTVAQYFGETPTTSSAGLLGGSNVDVKLVDIERVEVLRGPQGTAFGNASMGGAVRTIPVAPKLGLFEGTVGAGYSLTSGTGGDNYNFQAVANIPIVKDKIAFRATGYQYEERGFYRNRAGSDPSFQAATAAYGAQSFAADAEEVGDTQFTGGRIAALVQATDSLKLALSYLTQKTQTDGHAIATTGNYEQALLQVPPEHLVRDQKLGVFDTDIEIGNATMEYNRGWANVLATYSYISSGSTSRIAGGPLPSSFAGNNEHRGNIGEIRLTTQFDGAWNFLAGVYAEDLKNDSPAQDFWYGSPQTNPFFPGQRGPYSDVHRRREDKQTATFAEVSWEFLPQFTLTGGVRAYDYDRTRSDVRSGFFGTSSTKFDTDASGASYRSNLSYKPSNDVLVYAGWSQGFRLGQPVGAGLSPELCDVDRNGVVDGTNVSLESTTHVDSDELDNYELGGKFTLFDRRMMIGVDVYRMDWSSLPITVLAPCQRLYLANAGDARSEGVEFQATFYVTEPFRVDIGGSYVRAELTEDVPAQGWFSGDRLPGAPELNGNLGLQYEFSVGAATAHVRADAIYVGSFYGNVQQSASTRSGGYVKLDASARVTLGDTNIDLFVRNLTNSDDFTFRGVFAGGGEFAGYLLQPRTVGIQLGYNF